MKRKIFIVFMVIFTVYLAGCLFLGLVGGAPDGEAFGRYLFGALGISVLLPSGFTFFFISTLDLSKRLEEQEAQVKTEEGTEGCAEEPDATVAVPIPALVNAFAEERNLTQEEKERLLSYLEEL